MSSLYLIVNIASLSVPLIYSFEKRMHFIQWWKEVFLSILIVGTFFILWDVIFTDLGVWGFNRKYLVGITAINLPIEEWLFFICIPYASIFTHYAVIYFYPQFKLETTAIKIISGVLITFLLMVVIFNVDKKYTFYNFTLLIVLLLYGFFKNDKSIKIFYLTFCIILIPFFLVNGILTGSFIDEQIVWYNDAENLGIRLFTIPIEDVGYAFNLLYMNILLIEKLKK
ncbi:MAG: lycopene cyclase domain-containing protein [Bacteroidetes bacterium]|nr:lycopene cyclase domain-containing protein [Bacteroidota bacterium]